MRRSKGVCGVSVRSFVQQWFFQGAEEREGLAAAEHGVDVVVGRVAVQGRRGAGRADP